MLLCSKMLCSIAYGVRTTATALCFHACLCFDCFLIVFIVVFISFLIGIQVLFSTLCICFDLRMLYFCHTTFCRKHSFLLYVLRGIFYPFLCIVQCYLVYVPFSFPNVFLGWCHNIPFLFYLLLLNLHFSIFLNISCPSSLSSSSLLLQGIFFNK